GKLTFRPFEGIVAEEVQFHRRDTPAQRIARMDRLVVAPNLARLLRGQVVIDQLDLENASVAIPFTDDGVAPDTIRLEGIRAVILNGNGQLTISHAECWLGSIHVTVKGQLLNPDQVSTARRTPPTADHVEKRTNVLRSILQVLHRIQFSAPNPELAISLNGDLMHPEAIGADSVTLETGAVRFDGLQFDRISLAASFEDRTLRVSKLSASAGGSSLLLAGEWSFEDNVGHFDVRGGMDPVPLLSILGRAELAKDIAFQHPPTVEATLDLKSEKARLDLSLIGRIAIDGFRFKSLKARSFNAAFAWKNGQLYVQDAVLESSTGTVRANVLSAPGLFKLSLDSAAVPNEFSDFFGPKERVIIDLLEFKDVPKLKITLSGTRANLDALAGTGTIELGRAGMRGSWIDFAKSDVVIKDRAIIYNDLTIGKGRLRATGSFTYDFGRHEVRLDGIRSNLNPPDVLMWVDPRIAATVAVYRFRSPPDVRADGLAHMVDPTQNDLRVQVDAPGGLAYTLLNRDLILGATEATVWLKGQKVLADVQKSTLYGGRLTVHANVSTDPADPTFSTDVSADHVDFPSLTNLYFGYAKSEGAMSGKYSFKADLKNPSAMRGTGSLRVEDGHVMSIPLFGPLSEVISSIIPGAGHESARLATMDFTIGEQLIRTKNLEIQGPGFELFGDGSIGFPSGDLDLTVRINAKGIPGLVLFPVSKLLEYVSNGTVSEPDWRPKIVPKEFFDILGLGGKPEEKKPADEKKPAPAPTPSR
ncbi:MAG TPA: AsmA-like C-terminal region-containing protein, partial [Chthoniobacterales bacterium]|nr:AsmA-like C-terminal region-containing protein [Chthoniobacterales bacterium]